MTLSMAGAYTLSNDIGSPAVTRSPCLIVTTSNIMVDCAGHIIYGYLQFTDALSNVVIQNCVMTGTVNPKGISNVTISNSTMSNIVAVSYGHGVTLDHDHIVLTGGRPGAVVILFGGGQNQVIGCTIDGFYTGNDLTGNGGDAPGADDGIELDNETGDTIRDNTIKNVFDAGVEGVDSVTATAISNNTVTHAISAGIGAYWCTHWGNNTVSGNTVSESESAVWIIYESSNQHCQVPFAAGQFASNTISGNVLRNSLGFPNVPAVLMSFDLAPGSVTANSVNANDVGTQGIVLVPSTGFVVGMGNVCGPLPGTPGAISC